MGREKCQRCGEIDYDRRTLWMACLYAMDEIGLPFGKETLFSVPIDKRMTIVKKADEFDLKNGKRIAITPAQVTTTAPLDPREFFTLRVCKDCRADWMAVIKLWFEETPKVKTGCGSGIFVRENGATVEITEKEWHRRNPGREPVRVTESPPRKAGAKERE